VLLVPLERVVPLGQGWQGLVAASHLLLWTQVLQLA
jgi:hypothetical protein